MNRPLRTLLQAGLEAQSVGDLETARRHYLEAARLLLAQAQRVPSPQRRQERYAQAQRIQARVRDLERLLTQQQIQRERLRAHSAPEEPPWLLAERPQVRFHHVAGLEQVKEQIRVKFIHPFTHPEDARRYGIHPGGGILLYGPPGTGKTHVARAVAGELDAAFLVARASDLMSQWFGKAEQNIAALFQAARSRAPSVLFLDEIEALLPRRSGTRSSVMPRVVSEFLSQAQGVGAGEEQGAILLIGATNEPWAVDPAALRPGRFDELIYVGLPDLAARRHLLTLNLQDRPLGPDVDLDHLAAMTEGYSGADIAYICRRVGERAFLDAVEHNRARDIEWADFQAVLTQRQPSVPPTLLRKYEEFQHKRKAG